MNPWRAALLTAALLQAGATVAWSQAAKTPPAPAPLTGLDVTALEYREIADSFVKARKAADDARHDRLHRLIQVQIDEADGMLAEKKKTGNVTGIAVANQAKQLFESAMTNLAANGNCEITEKVRRELEETVAHYNAAKVKIDAVFTDEVAQLLKTHQDRFAAAVIQNVPAAKGLGQEAALAAAFKELVDRVAAPPPPPPPPPTNAPPTAVGTNAVFGTNTAAAAELPEILGESGPGTRWVTAAIVHADMMGVDVLDIPLANRPAGTNRTEQFNPISQRSSTIEFISLYPLPARTGLVYRLKRVPKREGVEILDWPQPRNNFRLQIRTRPSPRLPNPHGFEIQVSGPDALLDVLFFSGAHVDTLTPTTTANAAPLAPLPPVVPVTVGVATTPAGAAVSLDDKPLKDVRTPCRLRLPPGTQTLKVSLPGYADGVFSSQLLRTNRTLTWTFQPDPRIVRKTLVVPANATNWVTVADIKAGARLAIAAEGTWSCAGSAPIGPEGYPNNEANYKIYMNPADYPRQAPSASYGALIWRIGPEGRSTGVGHSLRTTVDQSGELQLDINQSPDAKARAANTGSLTVTVNILPPP